MTNQKPIYLLIAHGYPFQKIGGVGQVLAQLVKYLPTLGWDVHLLIPELSRKNIRPRIVSETTTWGTLHIIHRPVWHWSQAWKDPTTNQILRQWIANIQPHTLHIHHLNGLPYQWLIDAKIQHKHLTLHDYALPCARGQLLDRWFQVCDQPNPDKCLDCIAGWLVLERQKKQRLAERFTLSTLLLESMNTIDAPSEDLRQRVQTIYPKVRIDHCDLPIEHRPAIARQPSNQHRFLFVGSIHPSKGVHLVLQSFVGLKDPNVQLTIIGGDGHSDTHPNYPQIWRTFANQSPRIKWLGSMGHDAVLQAMESHDTLILPSLWPENSPIVIREALQQSMKVICGRGGSVELDQNIVQLQTISVHALAVAMKKTLSSPPPKPVRYPPPEQIVTQWIGSPL